MGTSGGTYSGPQEISYLFVDGGYLRKLAEKFGSEFFGGEVLPINYAALGGRFTKSFYYDCLPAPRTGESLEAHETRVSPQRAQLSAIRSLRGWHVVEGVMAGTGSRARQKQVDIHIAVDLLTHSYRRNMHRAAFIAGDQDFKPVVEAVVRDGMFIQIWYERSSASVDLLDAADDRRELDITVSTGLWRHNSRTNTLSRVVPTPRNPSPRQRSSSARASALEERPVSTPTTGTTFLYVGRLRAPVSRCTCLTSTTNSSNSSQRRWTAKSRGRTSRRRA